MKFKNYQIGLIVVFVIYFTFLLYLSVTSSVESDEGTHLLVSKFYMDTAKFAIKHPSISEIYNYGINYLVIYPKISIHYPPLVPSFRALLFATMGVSYIVGRISSLPFVGLVILLTYKFSKFLYKKEKIAILSVLIVASMPIVIFLGRSVLLDLAAGFFTGLVVFLYLKAFKSGKQKDYLIAGIGLFLGFMTKWFIFLMPFILFIYWFLEKKQDLKKLIISFVLFGILSLPYIFFVFKTGLAQLFFQPQGAFYAGFGEGDPQFTTVAGWLHYPIKISQWYLVFPFSLLLFAGILFYAKEKAPHWKLFLLWILTFYLYLTISPNKDYRYIIDLLIPFTLITAYFSNYMIKNFRKPFTVILIILIMSNAAMSLTVINFHPTYDEQVSKFLLENPAPFYLTSETSAIYPSYLMFNLAKEDDFIKAYRNCALEKSSDFNQTLYEYSVKWVIHDPDRRTVTIDPRMENIIAMLKEQDLLEFETKIGEIEIYKYKYYDGHEPPKCNYICLLRDFVCVNN